MISSYHTCCISVKIIRAAGMFFPVSNLQVGRVQLERLHNFVCVMQTVPAQCKCNEAESLYA